MPVSSPSGLPVQPNRSPLGTRTPPCSWTVRVRALMPRCRLWEALWTLLGPSNPDSHQDAAQVTALLFPVSSLTNCSQRISSFYSLDLIIIIFYLWYEIWHGNSKVKTGQAGVHPDDLKPAQEHCVCTNMVMPDWEFVYNLSNHISAMNMLRGMFLSLMRTETKIWDYAVMLAY